MTDHIEKQGHEVHSPTMADHGNGVSRAVSHDDCVVSVAGYIDDRELAGFVMVGHSSGRSVIARNIARMPVRIRRLVVSNAFGPTKGTNVLDTAPLAYQPLFPKLAA